MTITATPWGTIAELPGVLAQPLTPEQAELVERNHNLVRWYYKRCIGIQTGDWSLLHLRRKWILPGFQRLCAAPETAAKT